MDIIFGNNRIRKKCRKPEGKLKLRLDSVYAAANLEELMKLPGHCHPLRGNRKGQWAVDLEQPYRLILEPIDEPTSTPKEGLVDLEKTTAIRILEIVDYHD